MFSAITFDLLKSPMKHLFFSFLLAIVSLSASAQTQPDSPSHDCTINPGACQPVPVPSDCQPGAHWTLIGSGIAHCVQDDPPCTGGPVNHDAHGNPTNCQTSTTGTQGCGEGYTGSIKQLRAVYTWMDGSTTYGSWSTTSSTCEEILPPPAPEPTPPPPPTVDPVKCSNGASNYPQCTLPPEPSVCKQEVETTVTGRCPGGAPSHWDEQQYLVCRYPDGRVTKRESGVLHIFVKTCVGGHGPVEM